MMRTNFHFISLLLTFFFKASRDVNGSKLPFLFCILPLFVQNNSSSPPSLPLLTFQTCQGRIYRFALRNFKRVASFFPTFLPRSNCGAWIVKARNNIFISRSGNAMTSLVRALEKFSFRPCFLERESKDTSIIHIHKKRREEKKENI